MKINDIFYLASTQQQRYSFQIRQERIDSEAENFLQKGKRKALDYLISRGNILLVPFNFFSVKYQGARRALVRTSSGIDCCV